MRRVFTLLFVLALCAAACGLEEPNAAACDKVLQAQADGDVEAWRDAFSEDAQFVFTDGTRKHMFSSASWERDDFDGDGVNSLADGMQVEVALAPARGTTMEWECTALSDSEAEATVSYTDRFEQRAGLGDEPVAVTIRYTVSDNRIVEWEVLPAVDEETHEAAMEAITAVNMAYETWVHDTYPQHHPTMFFGTCCDSDINRTPESIALHIELIPEFLETNPGEASATPVQTP